MKTVRKDEIVGRLTESLNMAEENASELIDFVFHAIKETLEKGEQVKMPKFGNFSVLNKKERVGRNPKTKEKAMISPRRVVSFKASPVFKAQVNGMGISLKESGILEEE